MEETIRTIIEEFGRELWLGFITLVITGFILTIIKDLIKDLVFFFRARMSDIGYGQRIYYSGQIFIVDKISFKHIIAHDDKKRIMIPINKYIEGTIEYPNHRYDDFDEKNYHQPPWDGVTERRKDEA
jgi:hypothetical protein